MDLNRALGLAFLAIAMISISVSQTQSAIGHPHDSATTYMDIGEGIALEQTRIVMSVPSDNTMPWAFVEGKVTNPVDGYPVLVQIYDDGPEPLKIAQLDIAGDDTFEYKFRVYSVDDGQETRFFEGDYRVTISKVVYTELPASLKSA